MHQYFFVRYFIEGDNACTQLRIEPASRLVMGLGDPVAGPPLFELLFLLRVFQLRPGTDGGIEPYVEHVRNALHLFITIRAVECDLVDPRSVQVHTVPVVISFLQIVQRSDHMFPAAFTLPYGQRDTPVTLPGDAPVPGILHPVVLSRPSRPIGIPFSFQYLFEHPVLQFGHLEEPLSGGPVCYGGLASPAVPVAMGDVLRFQKSPLLGQKIHYLPIAVFREKTGPFSTFVGEIPLFVNGTEWR